MVSFKRLNFAMRQEPAETEAKIDADFCAVASAEARSEVPTDGPAAPALSLQIAEAPESDGGEPDATRANGTPLPRHPLEAARLSRGKHRWLVSSADGQNRDVNRDHEITEKIIHLVRALNEAMDEASRNGLIVEPALSKVQGRYGTAEGDGGHVVSIKLFRKLC